MKRHSTMRQSSFMSMSSQSSDSDLLQSSSSAGNPSTSLLSSTLLDAAALQTEMMKKYGMKGKTQFPLPKGAGNSRQRSDKRQSKEKSAAPSQQSCPSCHHLLTPDPDTKINTEFCEFCGYFFHHQKQELTLAQKRGLVPLPKDSSDPLQPLDWYLVERGIEKKLEPDAFCPICMGPFVQQAEVLLSCGHIFHKVCLRSFENFVKNQELSCPICRTKHYQKKMTGLGSLSYRKVCVVKIRRLWRGFVVRKSYQEQLKHYYQQGKGSETARKRYYEKQFRVVSDKIDQNMLKRNDQVNTLLSSMDQTLLQSRQLDVLFDQMLRERSTGRSTDNTMNTTISHTPGHTNDEFVSLYTYPFGSENTQLYQPEEIAVDMKCPWKDIADQAVSRGAGDCVICMVPIYCPFLFPTSQLSSSHHPLPQHPSLQNKKTMLLSCSHFFHEWCITSFEKFARSTEKYCPICRSSYQKRVLPT